MQQNIFCENVIDKEKSYLATASWVQQIISPVTRIALQKSMQNVQIAIKVKSCIAVFVHMKHTRDYRAFNTAPHTKC